MKHIIPMSNFPPYLNNIGNSSFSYEYIKNLIEVMKINSRNFLIVINKPIFFEISDEAYDFFVKLSGDSVINLDDEKYRDIKDEMNLFIKFGVFDEVMPKKETKIYIDNLCLLVAQSCNLACKYCFADEGKYNENIKNFMDIDTMKTAIDRYFEHNAENTSTINIEFFGGEPLLNKEIIKKAIQYCELNRKKYKFKLKYGLITNGVLLDEEIKNLLDHYNLYLRLSLDGGKNINDKYRIYKNESDSVYDTVIGNINKLNLDKSKIEIVMTYVDTKNNLLDSFKMLVKQGFKSFSINPLILNEYIRYDFPSQYEIYNKLMEQLKYIVNYIGELSIIGEIIQLEFLQKNIIQIYNPVSPCNLEKLQCSAASKNIIVNTKGDLFPCDLFLYEKKYKLA